MREPTNPNQPTSDTPKTMENEIVEIKIHSLSDLEKYYKYVEYIGNTRIYSSVEISKYRILVKEFTSQAFKFLTEEMDFIVIEEESGVLGFSPEGREIYREIPFAIFGNWKESFVKVCLKYLGIGN